MLPDLKTAPPEELYRLWSLCCRYEHRLKTAEINKQTILEEMDRRGDQFDWDLDEHDELVPLPRFDRNAIEKGDHR